jgi:uncharacterized protein YggU (UPF0235/DUF167 family)
MRLTSLGGSTRLDPAAPPAHLSGSLAVVPDPEVGLPGSLDVLAGILAQLRPRAGTTQCVFMRIIASLPTGDVTLLLPDLVDGIEWDEDLTQAVAFSFTVPASSGNWLRGVLGYEVQWGAPPPGLSRLRLELVYVTAAGAEAVYPLVTNGIAAKSTRSLSREGHLLQIEALGPWGRYDHAKVTLSLPPGHGQADGRIARELALLAGVPSSQIAISPGIGQPHRRAVDVVKEELRQVLDDLGSAGVRAFDFDRDGRMVAFDLAPIGDPEWIITLDQLAAASSLDLAADADVPTCITISGTAPEGPADVAGTVTAVEETITFSNFSIPGAVFTQQPDGSLATQPSPGPLPEAFLMTSRVTTRRTTVRGCLHREEVVTEGYFSPELARYTIDAAGALTAQPGYIYEPGAAAFDSAPSYLWGRHRFVEISRVTTLYYYDERTEELQRTEIYRAGWFNPPAALKQRTSPSQAWEDATYIAGTKVRGNGEGVFAFVETYLQGWELAGVDLLQARSIEVKDARNSGGYVLSETTAKKDWLALEGGDFQYHGEGPARRTQTFEGNDAGREEVIYSAIVGGGLQTITSTFDAAGKLVGQEIVKADGSLPAAARCDETDEARKSGRPWEVTVCAGHGALISQAGSFSSDWLETEGQAREYGVRYLRRAQALTASLQVPVNAALRRGMRIALFIPEAGIDLQGWVEKHSIGKSGRKGPILSTLTLKLRTF